MLEIIKDMPDNVIGVTAKGKVTAEDYEKTLVPAIEGKLKKYPKMVLYYLGPDFTGFTAGAMWDDAKVGFRHLTAFEKIALVSDIEWVLASVKFFALFIPCPVNIFHNSELSEAVAWSVK